MSGNVHSRTMLAEPREQQAESTHMSYTVGVRMKFGEDLEGLDVHADGLVFRSPVTLQPGRIIELIVCNGSILVDAIVMHCRPLQDAEGGFAVHVRYHHVSPALSALILEEIHRVTGRQVSSQD